MYSPSELLTLIEDRLDELGMTQAQLGLRAFGKSDNSAIQSLRKGSSPAIDRLEAMAAALGWEVYFGPPRQKLSGLKEPAAETDFIVTNVMRSGFVPVPWLNPQLGDESAPVAFLNSWLSSNGLLIDNLAASKVTEIHLTGFDPRKTLALVDRAAPRRGFGLWLFKRKLALVIAPVSFDDDAMIIQGSDPATPAQLLRNWRKSDIEPLAKVVWLGLLPPH